ncbi:ABC transporter ATP-binding protein [Ructibacterium gallinarum]|uniref:ABC transporter ATP-binding protein n=1 Tax=Ructibacterium gallinarum TaxID=2779355 RepID=A0A9D5LZ64_9FIRM|nr:ABC transporter ATP-binding protein [Ructibacterium gallinarum]MBE5039186.1 ABC transporter ATP-binding protein [Ructibacterium gallinarum]
MKYQIEVCGLTKYYRLYHGKGNPLCRKIYKTALDNVSFTAVSGETIGIIGKNGSGKSTLLKILSGITAPASGKVRIQGRVHALLELGAGFHPEYTGIQNIYLNGSIHGVSKQETKAKLPEILEFAGIGDYAKEPVRTYSDGMFVRLAFAAAACIRPDVLIVDEALAVGDFMFQAKCFRKMEELKKQGVTILYVTHDIDSVRKLCSRAIWLEEGRLMLDGEVGPVTSAYMEAAVTGGLGEKGLVPLRRFGTQPGAVQEVKTGRQWQWGKPVTISVTVQVPSCADPNNTAVSLAVRSREGLDLMVLSSWDWGLRMTPGEKQTAVFTFVNCFAPGKYVLSAGLERRDTLPISYYDYYEGSAWVESVSEQNWFGLFRPQAEIEINGKEKNKY